jgi:hypothetical protein
MATPDQARHVLDKTDPTGTVYSDVISLKLGSLFSLHIITGAVTGTMTLWVSNKDNPDLDDDDDWVENTDVTFTAIAGTSKEMINAGNAAGRFYRVKYVHSSGTGDLDVWANYGEA